MKNKGIDTAKLGLFVLAGLSFIVLLLYMIGVNRNSFGSSFTLKAHLTNVNGLVPGNNVRYKGIDVGTVKHLDIENDSMITVTMVIDRKVKPFIRKNALVSVGTDGLMGNKLININSQAGASPAVEKNDVLASIRPVETDEMLRTLNTTNENIARITENLYEISVKLNSSNSLWTILSDSVIATDLKVAVSEFRRAGTNTAELTYTARGIADSLRQGNGVAYELFADSTLAGTLKNSVNQLDVAMSNSAAVTAQLKATVDEMKSGQGTAGLLLTDSAFRANLFRSSANIQQGTDRFNENMEALKKNFLFRRYFRKLEKKRSREQKEALQKGPLHAKDQSR